MMHARLTFLGAAQTVTGSRYLIEANGARILVDCGLYQEREYKNRDWEPFAVAPGSIDAILLTHAHLDHCGFLPKLVKDGFHGPVYCTTATSEIAEITLLDSAHLQEEDAAFKARRHKKEGRSGPHGDLPLYTTQDARESIQRFSPIDYHQCVEVARGIEACYYDAGHVLGSAMIRVTIRQGGDQRTILFSGDVGRVGMPIIDEPTLFPRADYVVVESTYGDRLHGDHQDAVATFADVINSTARAKGNIIIPSFALERSQEILYHLNHLLMEDRIPHVMVFVDSPMAVAVTKVFQQHPELFDTDMKKLIRQNRSPFEFPGLNLVSTVDESKAINHIAGTVIVIAGSGMCTGGRIKHHLAANISRPESTILFVGYQAQGTLGRQIVDGAKTVRILGQEYPVRARIVDGGGFSAHADRDGLFKWLSALRKAPRRVFVTHGEPSAAQSLADLIMEKTTWKAEVPEYKQEAVLE